MAVAASGVTEGIGAVVCGAGDTDRVGASAVGVASGRGEAGNVVTGEGNFSTLQATSVRADATATRIITKMRIAKLHSTFDNHSAMDFIQGRRSGRTQRRKGRRGRQILLVVLASLREIGLYLAHVCTCLMIHWTRQSCYDSITSLASKSIATLVNFDQSTRQF